MSFLPWIRRSLGLSLALGLLMPVLAEPVTPAAPVAKVSAFPAKGNRVILLVAAALPKPSLSDAEREKLVAELRKNLEGELGKAGLVVVDPQKNEMARKSAEEWAVLQGATPEQIVAAVKPFAVDGVLRMTVRVVEPRHLPLGPDGRESGWLALWRMSVEVIDTKDKGALVVWPIAPVLKAPAALGNASGTAAKACEAAIGDIPVRLAETLKSKITPAVPPATTAPKGN